MDDSPFGRIRSRRSFGIDPVEEAVHTYRLRVAFRDRRGIVRPPARDETLEAANVRDAIGALLSDADSLLVEGTNLAWLSDDADNLLWTLRMDEHCAETT